MTLQIALLWVLKIKYNVDLEIESELVRLYYIIYWISILQPHLGGGNQGSHGIHKSQWHVLALYD